MMNRQPLTQVAVAQPHNKFKIKIAPIIFYRQFNFYLIATKIFSANFWLTLER